MSFGMAKAKIKPFFADVLNQKKGKEKEIQRLRFVCSKFIQALINISFLNSQCKNMLCNIHSGLEKTSKNHERHEHFRF